jgi:hypothetical protein
MEVSLMSSLSQFSGGVPTGSIVRGQFANTAGYLPCDGSDQLVASYPTLDKTGLSTWGNNAWTARTLPTSQQWCGVAFGNSVFVAIGTSSTNAATSPDGITWTARTIPSGAYYAVIYAAGLFVAIGTSVCATSPDGITWTARTIGAFNWRTIAYGNGIFVAAHVSTESTVNQISTSPDGITWTARTIGSSIVSQNISFCNGRFILLPSAVGGSGVVGSYFYSSDGIYWFLRAMYSTNGTQLTSGWQTPMLYFKGKLLLFNNSYGGSYSLDGGVTWVLSPLTVDGVDLKSACLVNGVLMASSASYAPTSYIWYSFDGLTWSIKAASGNYTWGSSFFNAFAFGNNTFVNIQVGVASSTVAQSLALDSAKFRTPIQPNFSDVDRFYLKAA